MTSLNSVFNDYFAQYKNILTLIDTRIKLIFVISAIILNIYSKSPLLPLIITFLSTLSLIIIVKVPIHLLLIRLSMPLSIACIILIIQIFFHGTEPMFKLNIIGLKMIGFKEGLQYGIVIVSKVIGAVMLIMLLTMTTPIYKLLTAGLWLKIPYTFIEIAIFTYRYIFVLLQTAITIRDAQTVRLGYTNWYKGLRSWGELAGATIIKAYNQTISTHEAMISRGYYGKMNIEDKKDFDLYDYLAAIGLSMILIIMFYISRI